MTKLRYVLAASLAIGLAGGLAAAQSTSGTMSAADQAAATSGSTSGVTALQNNQGMTTAPASAPTMQSVTDTSMTARPATSASTVNANGVIVVSSPPVPDTPANRALFGGPMSNAGVHTSPIGN